MIIAEFYKDTKNINACKLKGTRYIIINKSVLWYKLKQIYDYIRVYWLVPIEKQWKNLIGKNLNFQNLYKKTSIILTRNNVENSKNN